MYTSTWEWIWNGHSRETFFSIIKYLQKIIDDFPATYAVEHLFRVQYEKDRKLFPDKQAQQFHHNIAQLFFLCMRACTEIQPPRCFPNHKSEFLRCVDWEKLKRGLNYLKGILYMKMYISPDSLNMI